MLTKLDVLGPFKNLGIKNSLACVDTPLAEDVEDRLFRDFTNAMPSLVMPIKTQFLEEYAEAMRLLHVQWASGRCACSLP